MNNPLNTSNNKATTAFARHARGPAKNHLPHLGPKPVRRARKRLQHRAAKMATAELKTLHDELNMLLKTVPGKAVSASKVQAVAKACFHARGEYKRAVYAVEQFIKKAPAHCRLAGVYAIDAVCRRSKAQLKEKDPFVARFGKEIGATLQCLDASSLEDRQRLVKVVCEWTKQKLFDVDFNNLAVIKRTRDDSRAALERAEQKASPRARSPSPEPQPHQKVSRFSSQPPPPQQFGGPYAGQGPPRGFSPQGMPPQGFSNGPPQGFPPQQFPPRGMPGPCLSVEIVAWSRRWSFVPRRWHAAAGLPAPAVPAAAVAAGRPAADAPAHPGGAARRLRATR